MNLPCQVLESAEDEEATACSVQGMVFHEEELGWCIVTNWGFDYGTNIINYTSVTSVNPVTGEQHTSLSKFLSLIKHVPVVLRISNYRTTRQLPGFSSKKDGVIRILKSALMGRPVYSTMHARKNTVLVPNIKFLNTQVLRKILKAQEALLKYDTLIPRSDREAELSPEAVRWRSGRQLEWLRLLAAKTFETSWTWERIKREYPAYQKSEIGHMFYIYDYKYSGEHRVRLVFDGSRQSPNTYNVTYAPTVRSESVRLFHLYAVE